MLAFMEYRYVTGESGITHISAKAGDDTEDTEKTMQAIAQAAKEVGYASVKTFRRAYVRAEGENAGKHKAE